jgi:hypothetical protein
MCVAALTMLLWGATALAARGGLQARLSLLGGWTDNVLNAPDMPGPGQFGRDSDLIFSIDPSLILTAGSSRAIVRLSYDFSAQLYVRHTELDSFANALRADGYFLTSGTTFLQLGAFVSEARLNTLTSATDMLGVAAVGLVDMLRLSLSERFYDDFTTRWRLSQLAAVNVVMPLEVNPNYTDNQTAELDLSLEYAWARDLGIVEVGTVFANYAELRGPAVNPDGSLDPNGIIRPLHRQFITPALLRWRHDFGQFLSSELAGGVVAVTDVATGGSLVEPTAIAALYYFRDSFTAGLDYLHSAIPNPLLGATFFGDAVNANARGLLGERTGLTLSANVGYQFARQVDVAAGLISATAHVLRGDLTLSFSPLARPRKVDLAIFARYQIISQWGNVTDAAPLPSYLRNAVYLGVSGAFPAEPAVPVPAGLGRRADRRDAPMISPTGRMQ